MANDHYISRFLTKPWEVGQRRLHYYDLDKGQFDDCSSESLFALDGLHSKSTGGVLNKFIESPVSKYRAALLRTGKFPPVDDPKLYRALVSLIILQVERDPDAYKPGELRLSLDDLATSGEGLVNTVASFVEHRQLRLIVATLPDDAPPLFFTKAVYFFIPMTGTPPMWAVPLTPRHFVALSEKGYVGQQLGDWLNDKNALMSAFSLGVSSWARRIVIPPESIASKTADPNSFAAKLRELRISSRKAFNAIGIANQFAGLPGFIVKEHYEDDLAEFERLERLAAQSGGGEDSPD